MERKLLFLCILLLVPAMVLLAESLDKVWIIEQDTGSAETMVRLDTPDLSPDQTIELYVEENGLSARWGEGFAYYTYTYYSESGKKIWASREYTKKKRTGEDTWAFEHVQRIRLPKDIPDGRYRLGFTLTDYHTKTVYKGNVQFTVGKSGEKEVESTARKAQKEIIPVAVAASSEYVSMIGEVELRLDAIKKSDNRLTITMMAENRGTAEESLRIYSYTTRIISDEGDEYVFAQDGGGGTLSKGIDLTPGVPIEAIHYYTRPVPSKVSHIALLEVDFYYKDDKILWKDISVPWPADE